LYALEVAKAGEELLPFVGRLYTKAEFRVLKEVNPHLKKYALRAEANVYQDGDVVHGNVARFINSSAGQTHIGNVHWEWSDLPRPWNVQEWGYTMTVATRDITVGEELYTYYPVN
jgi:hypothetical protein